MRTATHAVLVLASIAAAGCSRGSSRPAPPASSAAAATTSSVSSAAPPAVASSAPAPASAAASASDEPAPLPLPPPPRGADPERATLAASICAAAYIGKNVGCRSHPPFDRPDQKPDGKFVEHKGDPLLFCMIDGVFHGSFTRPGSKQAVVSFAQCKESEDAVWDMGFPGSAVLVEEIGGRWKAIGYEAGVNTGGCLKDRRADGRDILVCRSGLAAPPSGEIDYVFFIDFARAAAGKKENAASIVKLYGDNANCFFADLGGLPDGFVALDVVSMSMADLNKDGTGDLLVKVRRSRVAPSPALDARVHAICKQNTNADFAKVLLPPAKEATLELLSDGDGFTPSAATKKTLDAWTAEGPEGFHGMTAAGPPMFEK